MVKAITLLREIIALPSVNPAFLPEGHPRAGERQVAEFLAATAANAGLDVSFQPIFRGRSNLLARVVPQGKAKQTILLAPHMDTVDGTDEQFVPRTHAGRLYGRGACDTKGSAAAMMTALCRLAASRKRPAETEIVFAGLIDEEHAQAGSRALTRNGFQAALAVIGEPTRLKVVTAHKGSLWVRLETRGKSAHGSRPELGRNAIHDMARIIKLLETEYAAALSRRRHPLLGTATVNVGIINGGIQPNIVPDRCSLTLDRRTLPGETQATVWRELAELLRLNKLQGFLADDKAAPCLPMETDPSLPLVARFLKTVRQREPAGVHYFCDAANLSAAGIPSVVFGPGDIAQGHTADEWIEVAAVERAAALLFEFLASLP